MNNSLIDKLKVKAKDETGIEIDSNAFRKLKYFVERQYESDDEYLLKMIKFRKISSLITDINEDDCWDKEELLINFSHAKTFDDFVNIILDGYGLALDNNIIVENTLV
ncbi:hypothetical protein M4L39_14470 [Staphylococcus equorum]|uniref:hypothetical protein n=1 Tax=Staphylococcus equorum TaxID=246432 RepID=UPI0024085263|nr:hypothetical protein [Staphylococcus equorum]MDG0844610.1 hypothetical protein [Staphylococcus equorum]